MSLPFAKKSLGQHFLVDKTVIERIVRAIDPQLGEAIVEVGPGPGILTRPLLEAGAHVTVVEKDERMVELLKEMQTDFTHLAIHHGDALEVNLANIAGKNCKVVGNLPYNVGTQIVLNAIQAPPGHFSEMVFMLQKEVIDRICAQPGGKSWGRLGVWCDLLTDRKKLFHVPPGAFRPPPKVMSSVVRLTPFSAPQHEVDFKKLQALLGQAFGQRRKMLRASLKGKISPAAFEEAGILPTQRPEELSTEQLCQLANKLLG